MINKSFKWVKLVTSSDCLFLCLFVAGSIVVVNLTSPKRKSHTDPNELKMLDPVSPMTEPVSPRVRKLVHLSGELTPFSKVCFPKQTLWPENPFLPEDIPEILDFIDKHRDYRSYHLLLNLRIYYRENYNEIADANKAIILCSAMKYSMFMNDWGTLYERKPFHWHSGIALLETKKAALKPLTILLEDESVAPRFGTETHNYYFYRRKDYAHRYIAIILGEQYVFHENITERDEAIQDLKDRLKKGRY